MKTSRREFVKLTTVGAAAMAAGMPAVRRGWAAEPIKIGVPTVLTGAYSEYGTQVNRAIALFESDMKGKSVLGRPIQFVFEDTGGDPANAVRKAQKLVEKDGVKYLIGVVLSSEALAIAAKCPEWKVLTISTINGVGSLTAKNFNRYVFRVNTSGPMGTRAMSLYLAESPMKRFFCLASDYAWGRSSAASFEKDVKAMGKQYLGSDFVPLNTKDFASYITKIKQAKPDAYYVVVPGQDAIIFSKQAHQFGLSREAKPMWENLELEMMKEVGDPIVGAIGSSRYPFTVDTPKNRDFVKRFYARHKVWPDMFDGETYEGIEWLAQVFQKAGTADDVEKVIAVWEDSTYDALEGKFTMRQCDHQAVQPGFVVEAVKDPKYPHAIPKILATYPGDKVTPKCRSEEF